MCAHLIFASKNNTSIRKIFICLELHSQPAFATEIAQGHKQAIQPISVRVNFDLFSCTVLDMVRLFIVLLYCMNSYASTEMYGNLSAIDAIQ